MKGIVPIESIHQVHHFLGLGKPWHPLVSVINWETAMNTVAMKQQYFALGLYQISFKAGIAGSINYGKSTYDFEEGTLIFTAPGQVLEFNPMEELLENHMGWSLVFHPDLIRKASLGKTIENYSFFSYAANEALHLSEQEKQSIQEIVRKIEQEYKQQIDKHSQKLMVANIELLLDYCLRYYDRQFYTRTNLNKDFVTKFEQLLKNYFNSDQPLELGVPTVKYCGQALNMSPYYLSDLLKKETGKNAQEHIHYYLIEKAKMNLLGSTHSISQIAYGLGFEYPQHFSKIFKRKTGMSPSQYRKN